MREDPIGICAKSCNFGQTPGLVMRKCLWLCCLGLLVSCELFISTAEKTEKIVHEELNTIHWNAVDQYPLFQDCDETAAKTVQRQCFQAMMLKHFSRAFKKQQFQAAYEFKDTIYLHFIIDEQGFISLLNVEKKTTVPPEFIAMMPEIIERLNNNTPVKPAIKRGIPVRLRFRLPLVLHTP